MNDPATTPADAGSSPAQVTTNPRRSEVPVAAPRNRRQGDRRDGSDRRQSAPHDASDVTTQQVVSGELPIDTAKTGGAKRGPTSAAKRLGLRAEQAKWTFALPDGARRLVASRDFEGRTNDSLVRWLASDPDLSRRLLRWCNTPLYNLSTPFQTLEEAAGVLEGRDLARLAVLAWVRTLFQPDVRLDIYSRDFLWSHSIAVGSVASMITRTCGVGDASDAMVAGTLHDIGLCVAERLDPESFLEVLQSIDPLSPTHEVEQDHYGWDHAELGAAVMGHWGMPEPVLAAARWHHDEDRGMQDPDADTIASVMVADYFVSRFGIGSTGSPTLSPPPPSVLSRLRIDAGLLPLLWKQVPAAVEAVKRLR